MAENQQNCYVTNRVLQLPLRFRGIVYGIENVSEIKTRRHEFKIKFWNRNNSSTTTEDSTDVDQYLGNI